jgi:hypothetical protein
MLETMNPEALARLRSVLQTHVDQGLLPGAVALVHHRGQTVLHEAVGHQRPPSAETATPAMAPDTVFRIYSMTKPIASLVAMMLMEEGPPVAVAPGGPLPARLCRAAGVRPGHGRHHPRPARGHRARPAAPHRRPELRLGPGHRARRLPRRAHRIAPPQQHRAGGRTRPAAAGTRPRHLLGIQPRHRCAGRCAGGDRGRAAGRHPAAARVRPAGHARHRFFGARSAAAPPGRALCTRPADRPESGADRRDRTPRVRVGRRRAGVHRPRLRALSATDAGPGHRTGPARPRAAAGRRHGGFHDGRPPGLPARGGRHSAHRPRLWPGRGRAHSTGLATRPGSAGQYSWSGLGGTFFFVDPAEDLFAIILTQAPGQLRYLCELYPALVYAAL